MFKIYGLTVDNQTRCQHYHSVLDIIAIKFKCCDKFYLAINATKPVKRTLLNVGKRLNLIRRRFYAVIAIIL